MMNEGEPSVQPSGEATRRRAVGGALPGAMDAALTAAWDDDAWVEALAHDEGLVELVVNLELAIETLRSALYRLPPLELDRGLRNADGSRASRTG